MRVDCRVSFVVIKLTEAKSDGISIKSRDIIDK